MRYLKQNQDSYVTVGPFIDKTDGFTLEDSFTVTNISYLWVTETQDSSDAHTTGTCDGTAANDWGMAAVGHGGMYTLKIPDAVINYVGSGFLTLWDADECLPVWHEFMVLPANMWDSMMGTDKQDVNAAEWLGQTIHAATVNGVPVVQLHDSAGAGGINAPANFEDLAVADTTGVVTANTTLIEGGDATDAINAACDTACSDQLIAVNLDHLMKTATAAADMTTEIADNTALSRILSAGDTSNFVPSTHSLVQIGTQITTGVAATVQAGSNTETAGTLIAGTYASTYLSNGVYYTIAPTNPGGFDVYLQFSLGATQYVNSVVIRGFFNAGATRNTNVYAYNYVTPGWDQLSDSVTRMNNATTNQQYTYTLLSAHRKADGEVRIRFLTTSTTTADRLNIDQCLVNVASSGASAADIANAVYAKLLTVVYEGGIWIDTVSGTAGTAIGVNGTVVNPVSNYAEALLLAATLGVKRFYLKPGTLLTGGNKLTQDHSNWRFIGAGEIDLNGQTITNCVFENVYEVSGTADGDDAVFNNSGIGTSTLHHAYFNNCVFKGTLTTVAGHDYYMHNCSDFVAGGTTTIVMTTGSNAYLRDWRGGIQINSLTDNGDEVIIDGAGRVIIDGSCTDGTIKVRGHFEVTGDAAFVAASGSFTDSSRWNEDQAIAEVTDLQSRAEPGQGAPAATADTALKVDYLYKAWRNKKTQTASEMDLYNDAGAVVDQKAAVSDDGTTLTSGEVGSGP